MTRVGSQRHQKKIMVGEGNVTVDLKKVEREVVKWIQLLPVVKYTEASTASQASAQVYEMTEQGCSIAHFVQW
jgi:hypothetical protein